MTKTVPVGGTPLRTVRGVSPWPALRATHHPGWPSPDLVEGRPANSGGLRGSSASRGTGPQWSVHSVRPDQ